MYIFCSSIKYVDDIFIDTLLSYYRFAHESNNKVGREISDDLVPGSGSSRKPKPEKSNKVFFRENKISKKRNQQNKITI